MGKNEYIGEEFLRQIIYEFVSIGHFEVYEYQMITHIIYYYYFFHSPFVKRQYLLRQMRTVHSDLHSLEH